MAYIGSQPTVGLVIKLSDIASSFDGILTTFQLSIPPGGAGNSFTPGSVFQIIVSLGGVIQNPATDYTLSGSQITFTTAPAAGLTCFIIALGQSINVGTPGAGTVTTSSFGTLTSIPLTGATSGTTTIQAPAVAGNNTLTLPTSNGSANQFLKNGATAGSLGYSSLVEDSSSRVGLGTSSPGGKLHIALTSSATTPIVNVGSFGVNGVVTLGSIANTSEQVYFGTGDVNGGGIAAGIGFLREAAGWNSSLAFYTNNVTSGPNGVSAIQEKARIDSSGRLLVGISTSNATFGSRLQVKSDNSVAGGIVIDHYENDTTGSFVFLAKSRSATVGTMTVVQNGDTLGSVRYYGADGTAHKEAASVKAEVDGTPGANDMPGRLVFSTTPDGSASPTERLRIQSSGDLRIANSTTFYPATDNAVSLGSGPTGPFRFSAVWAANGTIQTSDERDKTEIVDAQLGSDFIKALRPVSYKWIEGGKVDTGKRDEDGNYIYESVPGTRIHWGFIAQEVKQVVDSTGVDFGGWVLTDKDDPDSQQALRYDQFIAPLTKALQETMAELEALKAEVAALKGK